MAILLDNLQGLLPFFLCQCCFMRWRTVSKQKVSKMVRLWTFVLNCYLFCIFPPFIELSEQLKTVTNEVKGIKRTLQIITDAQEEILGIVKKLKRGQESEQFDFAKCCHTVSIFINIKYEVRRLLF